MAICAYEVGKIGFKVVSVSVRVRVGVIVATGLSDRPIVADDVLTSHTWDYHC